MASRISASPYARRLAREAGLPLASLSGSGPGGRIVARDLERPQTASVPQPMPRQVAANPAPPPQARSTGALAASLSLRPVMELVAAFAAAGRQIAPDELLRRAMPAIDAWGEPGLVALSGATLRPVAMPLPTGRNLLVTVCLDEVSAVAEVLLSFAAPPVEPEQAAEFLSTYRENLLNPLRLFA